MWGFITVMNDVLIPYLKGIFELSYFQAALVQFAFFGAFFIISMIYYLISISSGDPINRIGYKKAMMIGLGIMGVGCCMFYPAAEFQMYILFLGALFILATGVTILQIAANPYAAIMGTPETASSRLNLAQAFNSLGTTLAPIVGALLIYKVFSSGVVTIESVKLPYIIYGCIFFLLVTVIGFSKLPPFTNDEQIEKGLGALKFRHLSLGMIAIFMYVGAEVSIGSYIISFAGLPHIMGMEEAEAGAYLSYYWGGLMIGRFCGAISLSEIGSQGKKMLYMLGSTLATLFIIYMITSIKNDDGQFYMEFLAPAKMMMYLGLIALNFLAFYMGKSHAGRMLFIFSLVVIALLLVTAFGTGSVAFWAVIGIGLFNSVMWSNIFTLAIHDLGKYTSQGSSLLVMMVGGGAIIPPLQGLIADSSWGLQMSFILPIICYLYLAFYGAVGHVPNHSSDA